MKAHIWSTMLLLASCRTSAGEISQLPIHLIGTISELRSLVPSTWGYTALDSGRHKIVLLDPSMNVIREIGKLGNRPGDLLNPSAIVVTAKANIAVLDSGNQRIQMFSRNGDLVACFPVLANSSNIASDQQENLITSNPHGDGLIQIYSRKGVLIRQIGKHRKLSDFYGARVKSLDEQSRYSANRVVLTVDANDTIHYSHIVYPEIISEKQDGTVTSQRFETQAVLRRIVDEFTSRQRAPIRKSFEGDGAVAPHFVSSLAVGPSNSLALCIQWDSAYLVSVSESRVAVETEYLRGAVPDFVVFESAKNRYLAVELSFHPGVPGTIYQISKSSSSRTQTQKQ